MRRRLGAVPEWRGWKHEVEGGRTRGGRRGYWAEVPALPGCAMQGDSFEALLSNLYEAVEGCLSVDVREIPASNTGKMLEIAV